VFSLSKTVQNIGSSNLILAANEARRGRLAKSLVVFAAGAWRFSEIQVTALKQKIMAQKK
jgi:hypothetical protein